MCAKAARKHRPQIGKQVPRAQQIPQFLVAIGLMGIGCQTPSLTPVRVSDGDSAVEFAPSSSSLRLVRGDETLLRFDPDAWQVATVEKRLIDLL